MHTLCIIILTFFINSLIYAQEIPSYENTFNLFDGYNNQKLLNNAKFNSNLGIVNLEIDIPLPSTYPELPKILGLEYSTTSLKNFGMGYGFNWNLPQIIKVNDNPRVDFVFNDESGSTEMIKNGNSLYELGLKRFVTIIQNKDGFIAKYPSGKTREFNNDGLITKEWNNLKTAYIQYNWNKTLLKAISYTDKKIVILEYSRCDNLNQGTLKNQEIPFVENNRWYDPSQCLKEIVSSNISDKILFTYTIDNNLKRINWKQNDLMPIFSGEYSNTLINSDKNEIEIPESLSDVQIIGTPNEESILLTLNSDRIQFIKIDDLYQQMGFKKNKVLTFDEGGKFANILATDLNNDGLTDLIISYAPRDSGIREKNSIKKDGIWGWQGSEIYLAHIENGLTKFKKSNSFKLDAQFNLFDLKDNTGGATDIDKNSYYIRNVRFYAENHSTLLAGDFNGDKIADIVSCGRNNLIAYNSGTSFSYKKISPCHLESFVYDINNDGHSDIISKDKVTLGGPDGLKELVTLPDQLAKIQKQIKDIKYGVRDIDHDGIPEIVQKDQIIYSSDLHFDRNIEYWTPGEGIDKFKYIKRMPSTPILKVYSTKLGGKYTAHYDIQTNLPVLKKLELDPLKHGMPTIYEYEYKYPIIQKKSRDFLGYAIIETRKMPSALSSGSYQIDQYRETIIAKNNANFDLYRGLLFSTYICPFNKCSDLSRKLYLNHPITANDGHEKSISRRYDLYYAKDFPKYPLQDERQYFISNAVIETNILEARLRKSVDRRIVSSKKITNTLNEFTKFGPLLVQKETKGHGLETLVGNYETSDVYSKNILKKNILHEKLLPSEEIIIGLNHEKYRSEIRHNIFEYEGEPGTDNFKTITKMGVDADGNFLKKETITTDRFGRITEKDSTMEEKIDYHYSENHEKPNQISHENYQEFMAYDFWGNIISINKKSASGLTSSTRINRSVDGVPNAIKFNNNILEINYEFVPEYGIQINHNIQNDNGNTKESVLFDGFGKMIMTTTYGENNQYSEKLSYSGDGLLISKTLAQSGDTHNNIDKTSYFYDHNDKTTEISENDGNLTRSYFHSANCSTYTINGKFKDKRCSTADGLVRSIEIQDKTIPSDSQENGETISLGDLNITRDLLGNITEIYNYPLQKTLQKNEYDYKNMSSESTDKKLSYFPNGKLHILTNNAGKQNIFTYDDFDRLIETSSGDLTQKANYNEDGFITLLTTDFKDQTFKEKYTYLPNQLLNTIDANQSSIENRWDGKLLISQKPFIEDISWDENQHLTKIKYQKMEVDFKHSPRGQMEMFSTKDLTEKITYNNEDLVWGIENKNNKTNTNIQQIFAYDESWKPNIKKPSKGTRDNLARLQEGSIEYLNDKSSMITKIEGRDVIYRDHVTILSVGNENYLKDNLHLIDNHFIYYLKLQDKIIGAVISGKDINGFFPIVTDYKNSIRLIYNANGNLLVNRNYSSYGKLTEELSSAKLAKEVSTLIRYDFAGLIRPYQSNYLISQTRVYAPSYGEWLTFDPLLLEKPGSFIKNNIEEIDGVSYVTGDPINFVDPSGYNAWLVQDIQGAGGRGHSGIVVGNSRDGYLLMSMGTRGGGMPAILAGSTQEGVVIIQGTSLKDVVSKSHKVDTIQVYDKALSVETTRDQDLKMMKYGIERSQTDKSYSPFLNNCGDFVRDTFKSGGIDSSREMMPNDYYNSFKNEHLSSSETQISW